MKKKAKHFVLVLKGKTEENYTFDKVKIRKGKQSEDFIEVLNEADFSDKQVLTKGGFMLLAE